MSIKIEKNAYYDAFEYDYEKKCSIEEATTQLCFHYGKVTYKKFIDAKKLSKDEPDGNIQTILGIVWASAETIYHLSRTIFIGIPKAVKGQTEILQCHAFYVLRDIQEIVGRIKFLFNDPNGLYLIQESQFQKKCYDMFLSNSIPVNKEPTSPKPNSSSQASSKPSHKSKEHQEVEACFQCNDLSEAHKIIKNISNEKIKEPLFVKLAEEYFKKDDLKNALRVIKEIWHDHKTKERFIVKLAEAHYENDDLEDALRVIKEICHDHKSKEQFIVRLAEAHYENDDLEDALRVIKEICLDHVTKEQFIVRLAEAYYEKDDLEDALRVIKEICLDHETKELFLGKLAEAHYRKNDLGKALKVIKEICLDHQPKELFLAKLTQAYYRKNDLDNALEVIKEITHDGVIRANWLISIAYSFYGLGNKGRVQQVICEIVKGILIKLVVESKTPQNNYSEIMPRIVSLSKKISDDCFDQVAESFKGGYKPDDALNPIRQNTSKRIHELIK